MKTTGLVLILLFCGFAAALHAANVTNYDSIVSLATNATKNYTFTDSSSGQGIVVAVTMTGYSPSAGTILLQSLDSDQRVGGNFQNGFLDNSGVNLSATLVSSSGGVTVNSIRFRISAIGIRAADGAGTASWTSPASSVSAYLDNYAEIILPLDSTTATLPYSAQLRFPDNGLMQLSDVPAPGQSVVLTASFTVTNSADPLTNSWLTANSGKYARIYTSDANMASGNSVTTWSNGTQTQSVPAYAGVQAVYSSTNWVYIRSSGLASHVMGPWYLNSAHNMAFPNYPVNEKVLYRFPRNPAIPAGKTLTGLGAIGYFVDGVAMFDSRDGYVWTGSTESGSGTGYWNRDAYVNEKVTFDPGYAHQEQTGTHHYHADPIALRYQLGDHVDFDPTTRTYSESTNPVAAHSPILGWVRDGFPIYGPYGYSNPTNPASGVRRMISGYVLRNGQYGTQNLTTAGRNSIPAWAARLYNVSTNQSGPAVSSTYPLGRYMEDNDYLGDLGYVQGVDFDLDEYNGRFCVTPEFPKGTYAYFVSVSTNGTPVFPYDIGRAFYGDPTGSAVGSITENVTTNFLGETNQAPVLNAPAINTGVVTLTWSALEGGTYMVQSTTNLADWITNSTSVVAQLNTGSYMSSATGGARFYRVARTALATFDSVGLGGGSAGGLTATAPGGSARVNTTVTVTITLPTTPPWPPANAPISSVTLAGSIPGTGISDATQGQVVATFAIPDNAPTGAQSIVVVFNSGPTYTVNSLNITN